MRALTQAMLCRDFGPYGPLTLPYVSMGKVDSLDLFGLNELQIFAFYWRLRDRYKTAADIGANIGLHSEIMSKLWNVTAYEPDKDMFAVLSRLKNVKAINAAVSDRSGEAVFTQVMDNRTGSYIDGLKDGYGPVNHLYVPVIDAASIKADFWKIDAEGSEWKILSRVDHIDAVVEVGSKENAELIFAKFQGRIFSQKVNWAQAKTLSDMPYSHREGSIFIGDSL